MKIHYSMWRTNCTGGVRVIFEIINGLVEKGHEVTVSAISGEHTWFPLKAKVKYVPEKFRFSGRKSTILGLPSLYKLIKKEDADINVATFCLTAFPVAKYGKGRRKFYHLQHYEPIFSSNRIYKYFAKKSYGLGLNMVANSLWLKDQIKKNFNQELEVVNPGVDVSEFNPRKVKKNPEVKRIVSLGKPLRWKGNPELIKAFEIIRDKREDVELVLFGSDPKIKSKYPYTFKGKLIKDELVDLYNSADVVVCPSWYESFPLPPLEAMACGVPVVTTRYGTEDYAINEKNSLVVQPRDPKVLAEAILKVLDNKGLSQKLIKEGLKTPSKFTWKKAINKFEKIFMN